MSMTNILVAFNGTESAASALLYAANLVRANGGHVTAVLAHSTHEAVNSRAAWVPAKAQQIIQDANAEIIEQIEARFESYRTQLDLGDRLHFIRAAGRVDAILSECARGFDMIVVGQDQTESVDEHVTIHPDRIALLSGRPLVVVPMGYDATAQHSHAAVAWDGSRASARALSDSLGLLEDQGKVSVLTVGEDPLPRPMNDVLTHLSRHGIEAQHNDLPLQGDVAQTLLRFTRDHDPCLLVMGAYEHSKFREDFLGGLTAKILRAIDIPVLLAH